MTYQMFGEYNIELCRQDAHMEFPPPRAFQIVAHELLRDGARIGHRCQMLMSPTGSGKTYISLKLAYEALNKGKRVTFVCDRTTLITQTSETADRYGLSAHGIIQAQNPRFDLSFPFQIASAQTLARRQWPESDLTIIDEGHTQYKHVTDYINTTRSAVIALSATPFSAGLGKIYTNLINATTMDALIQNGDLVPMRVFSCTQADMSGAATAGGEWTDRAAEERGMDIIGDVVTEYIKFGEGRKSSCFGSTIKHCEEIARQFNEAGIPAKVFCSTTTADERKEILDEYRKPDSHWRILVSVEALAKGFDVPDVACILDCRPFRKSLSSFIQMIGRGLRSSPEKVDCILLDFSGNIIRFKKDFEEIYFNGLAELDSGEKLDKQIRREDDEEKENSACPRCKYQPFFKRCMSCGFEIVAKALVEHLPGEMKEIMIGKTKLADDSRHLYEQFVSYVRQNGKHETMKGRAAYLYKDIVGSFPPSHWGFDSVPTVPITAAVRNKIQQKNIAYAKAMSKGKK